MIEKSHLANWKNCFCNLDAVLYSLVQSVNWSMLGHGTYFSFYFKKEYIFKFRMILKALRKYMIIGLLL